MADGSTRLDCLVSLFRIEPFESFQVSIHDYRNGVIADHTEVFFTPQSPDRQEALYLLVVQHRLDHGVYLVRIQDRVQRMSGAIGIPK